ncbi:hypothetical protein AB0J90_14655 [Micromonospora sp. NPDC049523]|uniref:hypothetical protein n=1 Tax=Micromonospora sp. NPDC049523 TaxID=3155921 RepID=UPI00342451DF
MDPVTDRYVKVTVNLTRPADAALTRLATGWGVTRTDALNRATRLADVLHDLAPNGHLTITRPDGTIADVYLV